MPGPHPPEFRRRAIELAREVDENGERKYPIARLARDLKISEQTIAGPIEFSGVGLHTGENATMRILPAPAGKGIIFRRVDLDNFELRADIASVARVAYATTLMSRGVG